MFMGIGKLDIGPRLTTLNPTTQVTMVDCCVYILFLVVFMIFFMKMKEVIVSVMM